MNEQERDEIVELVTQRLDIMSAFRDLPADVQERFAQDIEPFLISRQKALRKPENTYTPRFTVDGADINTSVSGSTTQADQRGHEGVTLPRWVDLVNGDGWLDPDDPQMLHLRATGGSGADCMFDYLVSSCWATEVAAGEGTEGQTFTSLSGCTFKVYSTFTGVATDVATLSSGADVVIFACDGAYAEVSFTGPTSSNITIIGAGRDNVTISGSTSGGSALSWTNSTMTLRISNLTVTADNSSGARAIGPLTTTNTAGGTLTNLAISSGSNANGIGFDPGVASASWMISDCALSGNGYAICDGSNGSGSDIWSNVRMVNSQVSADKGINFSGDGHMYLANVHFSGPVGWDITTATASSHVYAVNCFFACTTAGIRAATNNLGFATLVACRFASCTTAIDFGTTANSASSWRIEGCEFVTATATDKAIDDTSGALTTSIILGNTFDGYNADNEIIGVDETDNIIAHNITDSGATLPDTHATELAAVFAPTPHNLVSVHHDGEQDYTNTLNLLGLGVSTGDITVYSDAGTTLTAAIDGATGHMGLAGNLTSDNNILTASETFTDPAAGKIGISGTVSTSISATNANTIRGLNFGVNAIATATATQSGILIPLRLNSSLSRTTGDFTVADLRMMEVGTLAVGTGVTLTDLYQIRLLEPTGAGAVTNSYGIYIPAMTKGATLNIPILSLGGNSRHVGAVTLGANAAATSGLILDITGVVGQKAGGVYRFYDADDSNYVGIRAPATAQSENWVYHLPSTDPVAKYKLQVATVSSPDATIEAIKDYTPIVVVFDGGGSVLSTGVQSPNPYLLEDLTVEGWTLLADQSGSVVIDIWHDTYANYPPTVADTITASDKPTITTATKGQDLAPTGWTTSLNAGSSLRFNIDSVTTIESVTLTLHCYRR